MSIPGNPPPRLPDLVRARDRLAFIYLERCFVHRDSNAITAQDERTRGGDPGVLDVLLDRPTCSPYARG